MSKLTISYSKIIPAYLGWWVLWMGIQGYLLRQLGFSWTITVTDAGITQIALALAGYSINTSMHFYNPSQKNALYVISWSVAFAAICAYVQHWILGQLMASQKGYIAFLDQSWLIRGLFDWFIITLIAILTWFWVFVREQHESEKRKEDMERLAREAELSNLRQQLQPHFLFNSLNSISALIGVSPEQARTMTQQLSDFLRGTLKKDDRQLVSLEEELQHLQLYLDIEKVRFGHRLGTIIHQDEDSLKLKLPSLLLQPIVENAIKFGLYDTVGAITIVIDTKTENQQLVIEIRNPFDPVTAQPRQGTGFGLNSVRRR